MKIFIFPPSSRVTALVALAKHLEIACELVSIDLGRGDQCTSSYAAMNPNMKMPMLEDEGFVLWESNAILFYLAQKRPGAGFWPSDTRCQADVLRWLAWESAHWDAESVGMVAYEKASKRVLGLGPADEAFIARGGQNFLRFAAVLDQALQGRRWLIGETLTIADFSIAALVPSAERLGLPVADFPEIARWYKALARLPAWQATIAEKDAAMAAWLAAHAQ
jgi:glutathione S-transferase